MDSEIVKVAIQEGPTNWPIILTAITAGGALFAAAAAWLNTVITNKARKQQLISDLLDYRYEKKMYQSMLALKNWYLDHKDWYDEHMDDEQAVDEEFQSIRDTTDKGRELDEHRKFFFTLLQEDKRPKSGWTDRRRGNPVSCESIGFIYAFEYRCADGEGNQTSFV